ncbi:MAG TPA: HAMP domain-containing sensor histidine kinase [Thermoanaerobaculia bacterium]|nr:HAMP domain-containing sensor histidine kinase [Thermoanaerobaculia bacterium]
MKRALLVVALLLVAAGLPCAAWFVAGSREAERESQRVVNESRDEARLAARAMAGQLGARLEKIRASESQRPYFHYQNLFHDPRGASQGLSVVPSPLAGGPTEPLILTHFQVDRKGRVTLPTLNDDVRELNTANVARERAMQQTLGAAAPEVLRDGGAALVSLEAEVGARRKRREAKLRKEEQRLARAAAPITPQPQPRPQPVQVAATPAPATENYNIVAPGTNMTQSVNVQRLDPIVFAQNAQSNIVYQELKAPAPSAKPNPRPKLPPRRAPEVEVATSDFSWSSIEIAGHRSLTALRPVVTPEGAAIQGFLVSQSALQDAIKSAGPTAACLQLTQKGGIPIGSSGWSIAIDERAASAPAIERAEEIRRTFRQTFFAGLGAASLALIAVAVLVWRTEKLARERAQFAAAAAHELRTPLAGLRLYGDMLAHQLGDPDRSRLYARQVAQEADRLGRVVTNMLEFTRLERGGLSIRAAEGNLGEAVRECIEQLRPALEAAGCLVNLQVADDLPPIAFDRDAVHQIVQNLLDNAEKYSRPSSERTIEVEVARFEGGAAVTVSDRGVGIDARVARHLFLPFARGGGHAPAGLGLGLVLVKALTQAHGGKVSWAARSGGGTTFRVVLPFYTP